MIESSLVLITRFTPAGFAIFMVMVLNESFAVTSLATRIVWGCRCEVQETATIP